MLQLDHAASCALQAEEFTACYQTIVTFWLGGPW